MSSIVKDLNCAGSEYFLLSFFGFLALYSAYSWYKDYKVKELQSMEPCLIFQGIQDTRFKQSCHLPLQLFSAFEKLVDQPSCHVGRCYFCTVNYGNLSKYFLILIDLLYSTYSFIPIWKCTIDIDFHTKIIRISYYNSMVVFYI